MCYLNVIHNLIPDQIKVDGGRGLSKYGPL